MAAGGTSILALAALAATLTSADEVTVPGMSVRLSDVALVSGPGSDAAAGVEIARLEPGASLPVDRRQLAALIARALPGAQVEAGGEGSLILRSPAAAPRLAAGRCVETVRKVAAGSAIQPSDVAEIPCESGRPAATGLRRSGRTVRAAADLEPGAYLGPLWLSAAPVFERGETLDLVSRSGPVTIRRKVVALQDAGQPDGRLFVRTSDGDVFSARISAEAAK